MKRTFAVIGGDARQGHLARLLAADGHRVIASGLEDRTGSVPLEEALEADRVVLPLPLSKEAGLLNGRERVELEALWRRLRPEQLLFGGQVSPGDSASAAAHGLELIDYFRREELTVANAVPTVLAKGRRPRKAPSSARRRTGPQGPGGKSRPSLPLAPLPGLTGSPFAPPELGEKGKPAGPERGPAGCKQRSMLRLRRRNSR